MGAYDVLSERELESRYEVFVEQYVAKLNIEAETTFSMAKTMLLPAAIRYLGELGLAGDGGDRGPGPRSPAWSTRSSRGSPRSSPRTNRRRTPGRSSRPGRWRTWDARASAPRRRAS